MNNNQQIINDTVIDQSIIKISNELKIIIKKKILDPTKQYIKKLKKDQKRWENIAHRKARGKIKDSLYRLVHEEKNIEIDLKESYYFIDKLREVITGEEIFYSIGTIVGRKANKKIIQVQLSLEEFLENIQLSLSADHTLRLKLRLNKTMLKNNKLGQNLAGKNENEIFRILYQYFQNFGQKYGLGNLGHFYEVLLNFQKNTSLVSGVLLKELDPNKENIQLNQIFEAVKRNFITFAQAGDITIEQSNKAIQIQSKYYNASVVDLKTILNILNNIKNICNSILSNKESEKNIKERLIDLFTTGHGSQAAKNIEELFRSGVEDELIKKLNEINLKYTINTG